MVVAKLQLILYSFLIYGAGSLCLTLADYRIPKLLVEETFEGEAYFRGAKLQAATSYGFKVVDSPVFEGNKSGRFELRNTDPEASGGTRAEFLFSEDTKLREGWYSFAAYFPSDKYKKDSSYDHVSQWHQGKGSGSPALLLVTEEDQFKMLIGGEGRKHQRYVLGDLEKDRWHAITIHVIHSAGDDGMVEAWLNDDKVLSYEGPTMYAKFGYPRWKVGIYKDDWNQGQTTDTEERVYYIDNVRLATSHRYSWNAE